MKRSIDTRTDTRLIAGAFCIVEKGKIVRAVRLRKEPGRTQLCWAAGRGSWGGDLDNPNTNGYWPVHYAA